MADHATVFPDAVSSVVTAQRIVLSSGRVGHNGDGPGVNERLYAAIPKAAKVLELGCGGGLLGERYKREHPGTHWVGVDVSGEALQLAATRLDATHCVDLDVAMLDNVGSDYDCVVMGNLLEQLKYPERLLEQLKAITVAEVALVMCVPNMSHISVLERLIMGDISYDDAGLLDRRQLRFYSCSSLFKLLLDCGWLPQLKNSELMHTPSLALKGALALSLNL